MGTNINTIRHIDHNHIGLTELSALNLAQGHDVWVHYTPKDDPLIVQYQHQHKQSVLAISERSAIIIEGSDIYTAGYETAYLFDKAGKRPVRKV